MMRTRSAGLLHAALEDVSDTEFLRDLGQVRRSTFVPQSGRARNNLEIADLRQAGEDFVLDSLGEIFVRLVFTQGGEGQNGDAFLQSSSPDSVASKKRRRIPGGELKEKQTAREHGDSDNERRELAFAPGGNGFVRRNIFGALHPLWSHLESPGNDERDQETGGDDGDECLHDPARRLEGREKDRGHLNEQPRDDRVGHRDLVNVAPFQLREETLRIHQQLHANQRRFLSRVQLQFVTSSG